jgi:phospholipid/cholesterol/gamma-HCH transport system ATP-binding protein
MNKTYSKETKNIQNVVSETNRKAVIRIKNVCKSFGNNHVLNGFNMQLFEGENVVVMGKSGSGKSVMIKCLVGLVWPDSGYIEVMGKEISTLDRQTLDELRSDIGFLFQYLHNKY